MTTFYHSEKQPQMNTDEHRLNLVSEKIIGCAFEVSNTLGCGFLEKVYQNALLIELRDTGLQVESEYFADLLVNATIIIEIKAVQNLNKIHQAQLLNYLKATTLHLGLLINFGAPKVQIKRMLSG